MTRACSSGRSSDGENKAASTSSASRGSVKTPASSADSTPALRSTDALCSGPHSKSRVRFNDFSTFMEQSFDYSAPEYTGPPGKALSSVKSRFSTRAAPDLTPGLPSDTKTFRWQAGISYFLPDGDQIINNFSSRMGVAMNQSDHDAGLTCEEVEGYESAYDFAVTCSRDLNDLHRELVSLTNHTNLSRDEAYDHFQSLLPRLQGEGSKADLQQEFQAVKTELRSFIDQGWEVARKANPTIVYHKYMPNSWVKEILSSPTFKPEDNPESSDTLGPTHNDQKRSSRDLPVV